MSLNENDVALLGVTRSFLSSPLWQTPIDSFVDENCVIFDKEEEEKFAYTDVHKKYIELAENLLAKHFEHLGVSEEHFQEVMAAAVGSGEYKDANRILKKLLAMEDYKSFKKVMLKRNLALTEEALQSMKNLNIGSGSNQDETSSEMRDFAAALKLSMDPSQQTGRTSSAQDMEDDLLQAAIRASVAEYDLQMSELKRQQAEIEEAIMLSLALEAARLESLQAMGESGVDGDLPALDEPSAALNASAKQDSAADAQPAAAATLSESKATSSDLAPKLGALPPISKPGFDVSSTEDALKKSGPSGANASKLGELKPGAMSFFLKRKQAAEEEMKRMREAVAQQELQAKLALQEECKVSDEELARRSEFLRIQKQLLLEKKNKERQQELNDFNKADESSSSSSSSSSASSSSAAATGGAAGVSKSLEESRREAMVRKLKNNMEQTLAKQARASEQDNPQERSIEDNIKQLQALRAQQLENETLSRSNLVEQERRRKEEMKKVHQTLKQSTGSSVFTDKDFE
jgi:hypothetical protein